jgi:hypothetical protein
VSEAIAAPLLAVAVLAAGAARNKKEQAHPPAVGGDGPAAAQGQEADAWYLCPMEECRHRQRGPGRCPTCGMNLERAPDGWTPPAAEPTGEPPAPEAQPTGVEGEPTTVLTSQLGTFGIGLFLGQPVGATAKVFLAPFHALQFGLGFDLVLRDAAVFTIDWVWHPTSIVGNSRLEFTWHAGLGASLGVWPAGHDYDCSGPDPMLGEEGPVTCREAWVQPGVRVPMGLELNFRDVPLEIFVEFAPGVFAYPEVGFLGQGGVGARWYL